MLLPPGFRARTGGRADRTCGAGGPPRLCACYPQPGPRVAAGRTGRGAAARTAMAVVDLCAPEAAIDHRAARAGPGRPHHADAGGASWPGAVRRLVDGACRYRRGQAAGRARAQFRQCAAPGTAQGAAAEREGQPAPGEVARAVRGRHACTAGPRRPCRCLAMAAGHTAPALAAGCAFALGAQARGSPAHAAQPGGKRTAAASGHDRRRPGRRTGRLDLGADPRAPARDQRGQRAAAPARDGHRPGRAPACRRLPVAAFAGAGLDGVRHGRAAAPGGRTHGDLVPRGLVPACSVQPQAADEEALGGNPPVPGPVPAAGAGAADPARAPALPRPRRDHGAGHHCSPALA